MSAPVLTALGLLTPLGEGREAFAAAWREGASAPRVAEGPTAGGVELGKLGLKDLFPAHKKSLRRMDRLSKLICAGVGLARDDGPGIGDLEGVGLAIGTDLGTLEETWNFVSRLRDKGPALANPLDFPNLVPNAGAGYAGIFLGLRGPSHTFCQHATCGDEALAWVGDGIAEGWMEAGLAGGAEELGAIRAQAVRVTGAGGDGAIPGEGSAVVLMETEERAAARGARPLARWLGCWCGSGRPERSPLRFSVAEEAVEATVRRALEASGTRPDQLGAVLSSHPHEPALAAAITRAVGRAVPATDHGERLGSHPADGAFRVALGALLLADRSLPVHRDGGPLQGDRALIVSAARGGAVRVTLLGAA